MRFFGIFSRTREYFWLKFHIWIVLNITYNFSIDTKLEKFHLHPFWVHFSIWLQSICVKNDFSQKVFMIEASNFPEMFTGSLSTTFVKTVWRFSHIDGSQIKKYAKKWGFSAFLENAWKFLAEISLVNSSQHSLQLFYWHQAREILSSPILRPFLAISRFYCSQYALKMVFIKKFTR